MTPRQRKLKRARDARYRERLRARRAFIEDGRRKLVEFAIEDIEERLDRVLHPERVKPPNLMRQYIEKHRVAAGLRIDAEDAARKEKFAEFWAANPNLLKTTGRLRKGATGRRRTGASLD